ncbi:MAG: AI-2E family transporter [Desulfatitalea sp.]|nr:AI-2E family transporter [Desulfatitalea sp.]NNK02280.1 AI-2E family transporter [Desulfatitalea sp.]
MAELNTRNPILWFFLICFIITIFGMGWLLSSFIPILILGAVGASVCYPLYATIHRPPRIGAPVAAFATCFIVFLILFIPIVFFVGSLTQQALGLYEMAKGAVFNDQINTLLTETHLLERINTVLSNFNYELTGNEIKNGVSEIVRQVGFFLYEQARNIASNTLSFVINFFLMLMVIYFLLVDGRPLVSYIIDLSPLPMDQERLLIGKFRKMTHAVLIGNGIAGVLQGVFGGVLFWISGFPSAFLWGVIMGLLAFIPIVGIGVVFIPTIIYLVAKGRIALSIVFIVFYLVVSGCTEYLFKPRLVGKQVKIHPLLIFFAIIGGLKMFGLLGIIYGPLMVTAFLTMADIYRANYQQFVESNPQ